MTLAAKRQRKPLTKELYGEWLDHIDRDPDAFFETLDPQARPLFLQLAFLCKAGEFKEGLGLERVSENIDRIEELHAIALQLADLESDGDKSRAWSTIWADLVRLLSNPLYDLYVILSPNFQESEKLLSLKSLAQKIWGSRIHHRNPKTQSIIRSLVASSGQSMFFETWRPEAIIVSTDKSKQAPVSRHKIRQGSAIDLALRGEYKAIDLSLPEYEKWLKTEAYKQLEGLVWEEGRATSRKEAKLKADFPEDMPHEKLSVLDALIAQETLQKVHRLIESPKYTHKMKTLLRAGLDLLKEHPDLPEQELLIKICDHLGITPVSARQIKSRIRKK